MEKINKIISLIKGIEQDLKNYNLSTKRPSENILNSSQEPFLLNILSPYEWFEHVFIYKLCQTYNFEDKKLNIFKNLKISPYFEEAISDTCIYKSKFLKKLYKIESLSRQL